MEARFEILVSSAQIQRARARLSGQLPLEFLLRPGYVRQPPLKQFEGANGDIPICGSDKYLSLVGFRHSSPELRTRRLSSGRRSKNFQDGHLPSTGQVLRQFKHLKYLLHRPTNLIIPPVRSSVFSWNPPGGPDIQQLSLTLGKRHRLPS